MDPSERLALSSKRSIASLGNCAVVRALSPAVKQSRLDTTLSQEFGPRQEASIEGRIDPPCPIFGSMERASQVGLLSSNTVFAESGTDSCERLHRHVYCNCSRRGWRTVHAKPRKIS
jgi:hypothetical protein